MASGKVTPRICRLRLSPRVSHAVDMIRPIATLAGLNGEDGSYSATIEVDRISEDSLIIKLLTFGLKSPQADLRNEPIFRVSYEHEGESFIGDVILGPQADSQSAYLRGVGSELPMLRRAKPRIVPGTPRMSTVVIG